MPNEIMDLILSSLHDALDIASFAMTSARNYEISRAHLEDKNNFVLWAGERIICVGSYAGWNDLPHEPFTGEELQRMYLQNEAHPDWGLDQHFEELRGSFPLDATVTSDPDRFWGHLSRRCQSAALKKDYSTLRSLTITTGTPAYDRMYKKITDPYVLRNLCTRQYIRGDTFQGPMCFHLALMIMTMRCYHELEDFLRLTEHQRISEPPPDAILSFRAPWVGHRFDIVELSRVEEAFPGSVIEFKEKDRTREDRQWTDISRGFKRLSRNVFKGRKLVLAK
ncbi:hypothetical protein H0H87_010748 [Tephrocybe sp. NHM501043]|nr:hypothetical protein H0H87_010748 [Tephrocybe sp. NHM501043]